MRNQAIWNIYPTIPMGTQLILITKPKVRLKLKTHNPTRRSQPCPSAMLILKIYLPWHKGRRLKSPQTIYLRPIRVLLKRVVRQLLPKIPSAVQNEYERFLTDPHNIRPNWEKYESLLQSSLQEFAKLSSNPVFILLDAYDEFVNTKGEERERRELRSCLVNLCTTSNARILITTRPHHLVKLETFPKSQATEILGNINDVQQYLERMKDEEISDLMKDKC